MSSLSIRRCNALPANLDPRTMYIVSDGDKEAVVYFTGIDSKVVRHTLSRADVSQMFADVKDAAIVDVLPPASPSLSGTLLCHRGNNNAPTWCNGVTWIDLSKVNAGSGGSSTIDDKTLRRIRNAVDFNIKIV